MKKFDEIIVNCLLIAAENSFNDLFEKVNETFYYCTLVMQELSVPYISAMSHEALNRLSTSNKTDIKWSYADSPYCGYGYNEFFSDVDKLFKTRFENLHNDEAIENEYLVWIASMEEVMRILDSTGVFGVGEKRYNVFINAEIMPPEDSNFERGKRLNPISTYEMWKKDWNIDNDYTTINWDEIWHPKTCDVILTSPVYDKKTIMKIKKTFSLNIDITSLIHHCANTPYIILKGGRLKFINKALDDLIEIQNQIEVRKTDEK